MTEVSAVNGADAAAKAQEAQASAKRNYTPVIAGAVLGGAAGAGAAALWGKSAPTLEEVFAQKPDVFKKTMEAAEKEDKTSATTLKDAKKEIETAAAGKKAEVKTAAEARKTQLDAAFNAEAAKADSDANKAKTALDKARKELDEFEIEVKPKEGDTPAVKKTVSNIRNEYIDAHKDLKAKDDIVKNAGDKATDAQKEAAKNAKTRFENAKKEFDMIKSKASEKVNAFNDAGKKVRQQRKNLAEGAKSDSDLGKAITTLNEKKDAVSKAVKEKTTEVLKKDEVKKAFDKIKGALKETSWKNIGIWGAGAAVAGIIAGMLLGGKKDA